MPLHVRHNLTPATGLWEARWYLVAGQSLGTGSTCAHVHLHASTCQHPAARVGTVPGQLCNFVTASARARLSCGTQSSNSSTQHLLDCSTKVVSLAVGSGSRSRPGRYMASTSTERHEQTLPNSVHGLQSHQDDIKPLAVGVIGKLRPGCGHAVCRSLNCWAAMRN